MSPRGMWQIIARAIVATFAVGADTEAKSDTFPASQAVSLMSALDTFPASQAVSLMSALCMKSGDTSA